MPMVDISEQSAATYISYQLKLIKIRAEVANLNHCAVPFLNPRRRQLVLIRLYTIHSSEHRIKHKVHIWHDRNRAKS